MADVRLIDANAYEYPGDLIHMPTIDAVPVVRCRECKWCELLPISAYCAMWGSITRRNGFCYRGEKTDGGAEDANGR